MAHKDYVIRVGAEKQNQTIQIFMRLSTGSKSAVTLKTPLKGLQTAFVEKATGLVRDYVLEQAS